MALQKTQITQQAVLDCFGFQMRLLILKMNDQTKKQALWCKEDSRNIRSYMKLS